MSKLEKIVSNAAGIDIGSEKVFVSVEGQPVRSFKTFTSSYRELGAFLKEFSIDKVAMEATGIYWVTLYDMLEGMGFEVFLVNPADSKNLPGRKTDVLDCQWIQTLFSYGLLKKSFVPDDLVRKLRVFTRMREDKIQMGASHINHMQKALVQMNLRLPEVLSQVHGVSGLAMIEAIIAGERNPKNLLLFCTPDLIKRKSTEILLALEGNYKEEYLFELQQAYEGYKFYQDQIKKCDLEAEKILKKIHQKTGSEYKDNQKNKPVRHNKPAINDLHDLLLGIQNINATVLPGITDYSLMRLTAELGNDINQWPNEKAFVSWLGLAPGKNQSGKMNKRSKKRAITRAGQIFKQAAQSIMQSTKIGLGVFARKLKAKRGPSVAIKATARKLAVLYYNLNKKGIEYIETGIAFYNQQQEEKLLKFLFKKAKDYNLQLVEI